MAFHSMSIAERTMFIYTCVHTGTGLVQYMSSALLICATNSDMEEAMSVFLKVGIMNREYVHGYICRGI